MVALGARCTWVCSRFALCAVYVYDFLGRSGESDCFSCGLLYGAGRRRAYRSWIADEDGTVFIYYASSDTRMHVATSTIDRLVDYCMNTPADGLFTSTSVETLKKQIDKNLKLMHTL